MAVGGRLSGIACRKLALIFASIFSIYLLYAYRSGVNHEIAQLQSRLQLSASNAEALATQLKVISKHKEKIGALLSEEKRGGLQLRNELASLKLQLNDLGREFNRSKNDLANCFTQVNLITNATIQQNDNTDSTNQHNFGLPLKTVNDSVAGTTNKYEKKFLIKNRQKTITSNKKLAQEHKWNTTTGRVGEGEPDEQEQKRQIMEPPHDRANEDAAHENYAMENAVHFHRHEPADRNVEFRRDKLGAGPHPGELAVPRIRGEPMQNVVVPEIGIIDKLGKEPRDEEPPHALSRRTPRRKPKRKDARENDDNDENVVDFRHDNGPDAKNMVDYKEMPE